MNLAKTYRAILDIEPKNELEILAKATLLELFPEKPDDSLSDLENRALAKTFTAIVADCEIEDESDYWEHLESVDWGNTAQRDAAVKQLRHIERACRIAGVLCE